MEININDLVGHLNADVWQQLSDEIGAEFIKGGVLGGCKVRLQHGPWTILLDTYDELQGETSTTYTRMRAVFSNPLGFRFKIYRKGFFDVVGKFLGMQDIEVGDPRFDDDHIIKGNDVSLVRELLADAQIRRMIHCEPKLELDVRLRSTASSDDLPEYPSELSLRVAGVVTDHWQFKALFAIATAMLDRLSKIGVARLQ